MMFVVISFLICFSILNHVPAAKVDGTKAFLDLTKDLMNGKASLKMAPKAVDAAFKKSIHNGWFVYSDPHTPNRLLWEENIMAPMLRLNRMYKKSPSDKAHYRAALLQLLKGTSQLRIPRAELPPPDFTLEEWTAGCQIGVIMLIHFQLQFLSKVDHAPPILRLSKLIGPKSGRAMQFYMDKNYGKLGVLYQQTLADLLQERPWTSASKS